MTGGIFNRSASTSAELVTLYYPKCFYYLQTIFKSWEMREIQNKKAKFSDRISVNWLMIEFFKTNNSSPILFLLD